MFSLIFKTNMLKFNDSSAAYVKFVFYTISHVLVRILQISRNMHFYDWQTQQKNLGVLKKGLPP
jgi:hypothetical protein